MTPLCISDYRRGDELLPGSPSFEPDADYDERMEQILAARNALLEAEQALDDTRGPQLGLCDQHMADAMNAMVPIMSAPATPCPYRGDCPTPDECGERKGCVLRPALSIFGKLWTVGVSPLTRDSHVEIHADDGRVITVVGLTKEECRACTHLLMRHAQISIQGALP